MYDRQPSPTIPDEPVQEIRSAEQVALHFPIAGPGTRILAYATDAALLLCIQVGVIGALLLTTPLAQALSEVLTPLLEQMRGSERPESVVVSMGMYTIVLLIIGQLILEWAYFMISERLTGGRSLGKRLVGLRVIGDDGLPLTPRASLVRNLLRAVDVLPGSYVVGLVSIVASPRYQRLGDLAAGTIVVRLDPGAPLALPLEAAPGEPAFRFSRAQIERLGQPERQLLRQTLRRLEVIDDAAQAEAVLARSVEVLRARLDYEPVPAAQGRAFLRALLRAEQRR